MILRAACALVFSFALATPGHAQEQSNGSYRVALLGLPVGTLNVAQVWNGASYDTKSQFETSALLSIVRDVGFVMRSRGQQSEAGLDPSFYRERMNTGQRKSNATFEFGSDDPRWDPNSAMMYVLNDRPAAGGCAMNETVFDGKRTHQLVISEAKPQNGELHCRGRMERTKGYRPKQLEKLKGYDFVVSYKVNGDTLVFQRAAVDTYYGKATLSPN